MKLVLCTAVLTAAAVTAQVHKSADRTAGRVPAHTAPNSAVNSSSSCLTPAASASACAAFQDLSRKASEALDVNPEQAVTLYRQALQMEPGWTEGWLYLGATLGQLQRYSEGRAAFQKGIPLAPQNGTAWAFLGLCEYELGNKARALENILQGEALGISPNPPFEGEVRVRAALVLVHSSSFETALDQLQPVAARNVTSPLLIQAAGLASLRISRYPSELSAEEMTFVKMAGQATWEFAAQHPAEAKAAFQELVAKYPAKAGVHFLNGMFLVDQDPEAARPEFLKELAVDPENAFAQTQLAFLDLKRGAPQDGLAHATAAVKLQPRNALAHAALGRTHLALGHLAEAVAELERAAKLAPTQPEMQFYLEQAYRRAGRLKEADAARSTFSRLKSQQDPLSVPANETTPGAQTPKEK